MSKLPEIYRRIKSMRSSLKSSSYEDIRQYLISSGYEEELVDHAIKYMSRKEKDEQSFLKEEGNTTSTINSYLSSICILILGAGTLFIALRLTYISLFSGTTLHTHKGLYIIELNAMWHIVALIVFWIGSAILIASGVAILRRQLAVRKSFLEKKKQGLL